MSEDEPAAPAARLLAVTLATHDAFTDAARAVAASGYAAEFAQRAEYQARIATHLRGHQAPEGLASDALRRMPDVRSDRTTPPMTGGSDPRALFDRCLRVMDAATLEFCRGYGPKVALILSSAMQGAYPINTTRHGARRSDRQYNSPGAVSGVPARPN